MDRANVAHDLQNGPKCVCLENSLPQLRGFGYLHSSLAIWDVQICD